MHLTPVAASGIMPSAPKLSSRARAALPNGAEGSLRGSPGTACDGDAACTQSKERRKERSLDFANAPLGMTPSRACLTVQAPRLRSTAALPRGPRTQQLESSPWPARHFRPYGEAHWISLMPQLILHQVVRA